MDKGLKKVMTEIARTQNPADTFRRDQTPETIAMRCALNLHPCDHRRNSSDNCCQHYPNEVIDNEND